MGEIKAGEPFQGNEQFEFWWRNYYGAPADYADPEEYWVRKHFAHAGWLAGLGGVLT